MFGLYAIQKKKKDQAALLHPERSLNSCGLHRLLDNTEW